MPDQKLVFEGLDLVVDARPHLHSCFWAALEDHGITLEALQEARAVADAARGAFYERRRQANRESAAVSRTRKRARVKDLEARVSELQQEVRELTDANLDLRRFLRREDSPAT